MTDGDISEKVDALLCRVSTQNPRVHVEKQSSKRLLNYLLLLISLFCIGFSFVIPIWDGKTGIERIESYFNSADVEPMPCLGDPEPYDYEYFYAPEHSFGLGDSVFKNVNKTFYHDFFHDNITAILEYRVNNGSWLDGNDYLNFSKEWDSDNIGWKITTGFDNPSDKWIDARFTIAIDRECLSYVNKSENYTYELNFSASGNYYNCVFNFSDLAGKADVIRQGIYEDKAYVRFIKYHVPQGYYEFDPWFGSKGEIGNSYLTSYAGSGYAYCLGINATAPSSGILDNITIRVGAMSTDLECHCAVYEHDGANYAGNCLGFTEIVDIKSTDDNTEITFDMLGDVEITGGTAYYLVIYPVECVDAANYIKNCNPSFGIYKNDACPWTNITNSPLSGETASIFEYYIYASYTPYFFSPTDDSSFATEWTNPENAYESDDSYADTWFDEDSNTQDYFNYTMDSYIPVDAVIDGITVRVEGHLDEGEEPVDMMIYITNDFGVSWTDPEVINICDTSDAFYDAGGVSYLWGESWTQDGLTDKSFVVLLEALGGEGEDSVHIDWVGVRVNWTPAAESPPEIEGINFVGHPNDMGGPAKIPMTPDDAPFGYCTANSMHYENWTIVNISISETYPAETVYINYTKDGGSSWTNGSQTMTAYDNGFYEENLTDITTTGKGFSFNIYALNSQGGDEVAWTKLDKDNNTARRWVKLNQTASYTMENDLLYFYHENYTFFTGDIEGGNANWGYDNQWFDQAVGTDNDSGILKVDVPTDTVEYLECGEAVWGWFNESVCFIGTQTWTDIYYHIFVANNDSGGNDEIAYLRLSNGRESPKDVDIDYPTTELNYSNATTTLRSILSVPYGNNYSLFTGLMTLNTPYTNITHNNIYELAVKVWGEAGHPYLFSNRSANSWVILNPDPAIINGSDNSTDTDSDGLSDHMELNTTYGYGTNPELADTDNDGINDYWEIQVGSDPNNYTDAPRINRRLGDFYFVGGNVSSNIQFGDFWFAGNNASNNIRLGNHWFVGNNVSSNIRLGDFWFLGGNIGSNNRLGDHWFLGGNESDNNRQGSFWFLGSNISNNYRQGNFWFTGNNISSNLRLGDFWFLGNNVSTNEQLGDFWFLGGNGSVKSNHRLGDFWFLGGNASEKNNQRLGNFWFLGGNESTNQKQGDHWFIGNNVSSNLRLGDFWFVGENTTLRINQRQGDFWFLGGNETGNQQLGDFWFLGGNVSLLIIISDEYPENESNLFDLQPTIHFTLTNPTGRLMNYTILYGNSTANCTNVLTTESGVTNGTYHYVNYYTATNYTEIYYYKISANDSANTVTEAYWFRPLMTGGGIVSSSGYMLGVALGGGALIFAFFALIVRRRRKNEY